MVLKILQNPKFWQRRICLYSPDYDLFFRCTYRHFDEVNQEVKHVHVELLSKGNEINKPKNIINDDNTRIKFLWIFENADNLRDDLSFSHAN